ncbi:hypothetical protein CSUB01_02153 [Colletotrichum sublineola]|uniref:Uncharacterized protein n=1 Tax=Colletotrichum sublineola TaxID=1173701 RepID=A0A066WUF1_COLSU|nr:hypothetical protein CSUB01_02153 [Colletotrichum sublineola]
MCEDRHSESTAGDGVASTRAHPPSARPPSPDPVASDPSVSTGRHIPRSPLASHTESLIDMQIPRASPSPHTSRKRSLDELFVDNTPPSPDKLQRELDRQHEEALEARRASTPLLQPDAHSRTQAQERKRRKELVYRGKPPEHGVHPHSNTKNGHNSDEDGEGDGGHVRDQRLRTPATSSE